MGNCFPRNEHVYQPVARKRPTSVGYGALRNSRDITSLSVSSLPYQPPSPYNPSYLTHTPVDITLEANTKGIRGRSTLSNKGTLERGGHVVRIATWNLLLFSEQKASQHLVLEVIVGVILANQLDLIAVQELSDRNALKLVCDELNRRKMGNWNYKVSERAGRMYRSNEYLGYLWNSSKGFCLKSDRLLTENKEFARSPYLAKFSIHKHHLLLVNVHLKAVGFAKEAINRTRDEVDLLSLLIQSVYSISDNTSVHPILLGDFNLSPDTDFDRLYCNGYQNLLAKGTHTNISARKPRGSMSYDNIWISMEALQTIYAGKCSVVREGLVDVDKRKEDRAATVSDHCPVWAAFKF